MPRERLPTLSASKDFPSAMGISEGRRGPSLCWISLDHQQYFN